VQDQIMRVGGSNAQREVFEDTLLQAYLRAGHLDRAEALLRRRLDRRPSARDYFWLGRAELDTGERASAERDLRRAHELWNHADSTSPELAALENVLRTIETPFQSSEGTR
jgi:uncharacterized protein HemY